MWYSGQHTTATGVTKRALFTGSSIGDNTSNFLTGMDPVAANNTNLTLPNGTVLNAPAGANWGTNSVNGLWRAYDSKNATSNYGPIMADLPADGSHPFLAVAGDSASTGLGMDYGLIHISCGANSATENCASQGDILTTITVANDSDYSQYNGLLDVVLYRGADTSLNSDRTAAAEITGVSDAANIQGSNLGTPIWSDHMIAVGDILSFSFIFNQSEWQDTDTNSSGLFSTGHTNGFYTLVIGAHSGLASDGVAYEVLVTTSAAPVPVPGAVWLFGSALAGFLGITRRKTAVRA